MNSKPSDTRDVEEATGHEDGNEPTLNKILAVQAEPITFWSPLTVQSSQLSWPFMFLLLAINVVLVGFPIFSIGYMIYSASEEYQGKALQAITAVLLVVFVCTAAFGFVLMIHTNSPSLSVMLSQRWNPLSYLTGHFLTALCYFCSAWVGSIFVMRSLLGRTDPEWKIMCSILSFVFLSMSQLFPRLRETTPRVLGVSTQIEHVAYAERGDIGLFTVFHPFWAKLGTRLTFMMHTGLALLGLGLSFAVIINFVSHYHHLRTTNIVLSMIMVAVAGVCELINVGAGMVADCKTANTPQWLLKWQNVMLSMEISFVYCVIIGVVLAVMADSELFDNYGG